MGFTKGDVVQLVSGGPLMTVSGVEGLHQIACVWFDVNNNRQEEFFEIATLRPLTIQYPEHLAATLLQVALSDSPTGMLQRSRVALVISNLTRDYTPDIRRQIANLGGDETFLRRGHEKGLWRYDAETKGQPVFVLGKVAK